MSDKYAGVCKQCGHHARYHSEDRCSWYECDCLGLEEVEARLLVIGEHIFPACPKSTALDAADRAEEDLVFGARDTLEALRCAPIPQQFRERGIGSWQGWLLFCAPHVAKYYGVDKDELLRGWMEHYGIGIAIVATAAHQPYTEE